MKLQIQCALIMLAVAGSMRCDPVTQLDPLSTTTIPGIPVTSIDWCGCNYLAVGEDGAGFEIYQFDPTTRTLSFATSANLFGVIPVKWCPASSCRYLAVGGHDNSGNGQIQIYQFEQSPTPTLIPIPGAHQQFGIEVDAIDWCPSCLYLAAGSFDNDVAIAGEIQLYYFDGVNLTPTFNPVVQLGNQIKSLEWCGDCQYLAAVDDISTLYIYSFDSQTGLIPAASYTSTSTYYSIDWCGDCGYIAAGGSDNISGLGIIDIYKFDPTSTSSILTVTTTVIQAPNGAGITSLSWCQGCDNLAVIGDRDDADFNETDFVQLYHFDTETQTLSFVQEYPLNFSVNIEASNLLSWCTDCSYLGVGGYDNNQNNGVIQLFRSEFFVPAPTVSAQKICHRFPTQTDIINKLCWDAVEGAVAYNVYEIEDTTQALAALANSTCQSCCNASSPRTVTVLTPRNAQQILTNVTVKMLLATITETPLCFCQHQICKGKQTTYYVTAIDADGDESAPAVVTI